MKILFWRSLLTIAVWTLGVSTEAFAGKSPSEVEKAVYTAANEGKYSETEQYLSADLLALVKGVGGELMGGDQGSVGHIDKAADD